MCSDSEAIRKTYGPAASGRTMKHATMSKRTLIGVIIVPWAFAVAMPL